MSSQYDDLRRPPLRQVELGNALVGKGLRWSEVVVVGAARSTNAALSEQARTDPRDGLVLIAEHQTAGRGRLDRGWVAVPRAGITMSVLVRPAGVPVVRWPWIPLLSGLAVAAAVRQVTGVAAALKWPNDVMVADRKLAGLLVERVEGAGEADPAAVIGIGLNVSTTTEELPAGATSLLVEEATTTDRLTLVKAVLRRLDSLLGAWEGATGLPSSGLLAAYRAACSTIGREVRVELAGQASVTGLATGVDETGRLLVDTPSGARVFGAGDVVHVRGLA